VTIIGSLIIYRSSSRTTHHTKDHYKRKGPLLKENKQKHNEEAKCNCKGERREVVEPEPHFSLLANNFPEKPFFSPFFSLYYTETAVFLFVPALPT
jgi:hypothetical protein